MRFGQAARMAGRTAGAMAALALLASCGRLGDPLEAMTGTAPSPDEFQVMHYQPPVVPNSYDLPKPTPGTPSPRAPKPEHEAIVALLGPNAQPVATSSAPSAGEQALLSSAKAASASSDIRVQLKQDKKRAEANKPYEPPTIWELLGFGSSTKKIDKSQVVDPDAEAKRLEAEGVPTPVDPNAAKREAAKAQQKTAESAPPEIDRVPHNTVSPPPQPAY